MQRFKKILVLIDIEAPAHASLERAARLARSNDQAVLKVVSVVEGLPWYARLFLPSSSELQDVIVQRRIERLDAIVAPLRQEGLSVATGVLRGRPATAAIQDVLMSSHDLLIKDAEADGHPLFGSTDMQLLRNCPCPVWIVKPSQRAEPFRRILAAVDPTPPPDETDVLHLRTKENREALNTKIIQIASALAEREGSDLHILHAWFVPGESLLRGETHLTQEQVDEYVEAMRDSEQRAFDELLGRVASQVSRENVHMIKGDPAEVITRFASQEGVDLIVMGTVARTGIPGLVIGNTAEAVLRQVDCSVLAVKPDDFVSPVSAEAS